VQGRAFLAWLAGVDELDSSKDLTKEQAQRALDRLGSGENGSYRTDKANVDKAFQDYAEHRPDSSSSVSSRIEKQPKPSCLP
jgi:hypothetical protein